MSDNQDKLKIVIEDGEITKTEVVTEEMVTITKSEYDELVNKAHFLDCLEAVGVDNWQPGYSEACQMMEEDNNES